MLVKGIAHITFSVSDFDRSLTFYQKIFDFLQLKPMINRPGHYYCVGQRMAMGIQQCADEFIGQKFNQASVGLHHYCLSLDSRAQVSALAELATGLGAKIIRQPSEQNHWLPGMFSTLFEDPDGIRIEANHILTKPKLL